jgi:Icc-related predicted phosphoesterase
VPPTPFRLKDWERYDVSRYVPPGSVSPEEGLRTVPVPENEARFSTIQDDLASLVGDNKTDNAVFMFHSPPHETRLDRAATDGKMVDHVPLDLHVGSVAVRRFIEKRQPLLTLHGHIHESTRITGSWRDRIGHTEMFNGSHHGPELSLVTFDLENPRSATRELL